MPETGLPRITDAGNRVSEKNSSRKLAPPLRYKPAPIRPGTVVRANVKERLQRLSIYSVCAHSLHTAYERGYAPHGYRGCGRRRNGRVRIGATNQQRPGLGGEIGSRDRPAVARR